MDKLHYLLVFICESMHAYSFQRFLARSIAQTSALLALLLVNNKLSSELSIILQSLLTIVNSQAGDSRSPWVIFTRTVGVLRLWLDNWTL